MTGREKVEAAFSAGGTDRMPAVICYEGIFVRDHWDELTDRPWWHRVSPDLRHQLGWRREVMARVPQDWFHLPVCLSRAERDATAIEERAGGVYRVDRRTGAAERLERPLIGGWDPRGIPPRVQPGPLPQTPAEVDRQTPPGEAFETGRFAAEGRGDLAAALLSEFGGERFPIVHVSSPLWRCYGVWGFEGLMLLIADRPDLVARACRRLLIDSIRQVHEAAAMGAAGVWIEECMTDLISPAAFEALNEPILRELIAAIRAAGLKSIYYYCGDPWPKWDLVASLGMDALSLEEGKKGFRIDIAEVVERLAGRCAVLGNLDAIRVLERGGDGELRAEIARQAAAGRRNGGRFILSLGSPVTPATPVRRVAAYCRMARELTP